MIHTDARFREAIEDAVGRIETRTDAEIVVVAAERSGIYTDVSATVAFAMAMAAFAVILVIPQPLHPVWVWIDLLLVWLVTERLARSRGVIRGFTTEVRRRTQVQAAAAMEFQRESVHGTKSRTGVLVYISALEGRVEIVTDLGVQARMPEGSLVAALRAFRKNDLDHFLSGMTALGDELATHVPRTEHGSGLDLPNAPRIRP